jgi:hypothetical protein
MVQCDNNLGPLHCAFTQQLNLYKMCQCLKTNGKRSIISQSCFQIPNSNPLTNYVLQLITFPLVTILIMSLTLAIAIFLVI